jgi:hypothetical protein
MIWRGSAHHRVLPGCAGSHPEGEVVTSELGLARN